MNVIMLFVVTGIYSLQILNTQQLFRIFSMQYTPVCNNYVTTM